MINKVKKKLNFYKYIGLDNMDAEFEKAIANINIDIGFASFILYALLYLPFYVYKLLTNFYIIAVIVMIFVIYCMFTSN